MEKIFYRVSIGDTVLGVAERFNVPATKIIKDNNLDKDIEQGDMLYIEKDESRLYKVLPCDTISSISQKFGVTEEEILSANNIEYVFYGLKIKV